MPKPSSSPKRIRLAFAQPAELDHAVEAGKNAVDVALVLAYKGLHGMFLAGGVALRKTRAIPTRNAFLPPPLLLCLVAAPPRCGVGG